ncbi:hypothetical protein CC86DRAFT_300596 [Ophiobolus disseminans]|uniref:Uncharacterized protein n=1 Tax=Ophiobolus disseminans TaxID=1469910 RepID=A0A6A6ZN25_9PLEO|nr:hypothetical protein CC86DRAFT_300596 [Ophiobolus disseminans]
MGRSLAQKDVQIKEYEIEIENFLKKIVAFQAEIYRLGKLVGEAEWLRTTIKEKDAAHAREIEDKDATVRRLEEANERLTRERDAATQAQVHAGNHATHAQNLVDVLSQREKFINGLREKLLVEQMHNTELEDKNDRLQEKVDEANVDDLKKQLREKSSQCDRFRNQVKSLERHAQAVQSRLNTALAGGVALRGGAHIVAPHEKSKLPKNVVSCSECYAKNISCDNAARCRNCVESLTKCARWRCSVKHKLGECNDTPCVLPHDAQGWLVTMEARPEW